MREDCTTIMAEREPNMSTTAEELDDLWEEVIDWMDEENKQPLED